MTLPPRLKQAGINILLTGATIMVTLVFLELLLWLTPYRSKVPFLAEPRDYWVNSADTGFDIGKNVPKDTHHFFDHEVTVWSNELGCFDTPYIDKQPIIYLTGDSFTWGFADFEDKWGTRIEKNTGMRVLKCGVGGFGTKQELLKTTNHFDELATKPSVLIVGYLGANDVEDDAFFPNYTVEQGYRVRDLRITPEHGVAHAIKRWLTVHSALYNLLKNRVKPLITAILPDAVLTSSGVTAPTKELKDPQTDEVYQEHLQNVLGFKQLADKYGAKLLFVLIPSRTEIRDTKTASTNDKLKPFLEANQIPYLDLFGAIEEAERSGKKLYWDVDGHWNNEGNAFVGDIVSDHLMNAQYVRSPNE